MFDLIKNSYDSFGDNFDFNKNKKWNLITSSKFEEINFHLPQIFLYTDYNIAKAKWNFIIHNSEYFRLWYFAFAPIFSIPLYQHNKTFEYIYDIKHNDNYSYFEHESIMNDLKDKIFKKSSTKVNKIIKTKFISSKDKYTDIIEATSYGYKLEKAIEYVTRKAGNGKYYDVEIEWDKFTPIVETVKLEITELEHYKKNNNIQTKISNILIAKNFVVKIL
ncbi:hypothetical protein [Mesomycoplasma neurolyticum]|uniref:Uncharacterized protein n=1 Tax=Mesomycoplasma neurolyticum TaxID=2120 RepID=A0A449A4H9_9BACT|nr:hypothetical protein [Mesomycoplasma neurolyticum]VEU59161.1 Uncharacterised protein [Mesomycoplasma neurolyticum]